MLYHFVLTYSNWETGTVCFSESYETISFGLQNALWELGCVPKYHQTDCLSAAINNLNVKVSDVSISHDKDYAIATVLIENDG